MQNLSRRKLIASVGLLAVTPALARGAEAPKQRIIVAGGHPGDPEYGCGGTIARLVDLGHEVVLLYLNRGDPNEKSGQAGPFPRVAEAAEACRILKARPHYAGQIDGRAIVDAERYQAFHKIIDSEKPAVLFTHWPIDNHADHRAMSLLCYDAWLRQKKSFTLFYYEVSNGEDTAFFTPTHYVDIAAAADRKRRACFAHVSQSPDRYYALQQMVTRFRGIESGHRDAEGFIHHPQSPAFALPQKS